MTTFSDARTRAADDANVNSSITTVANRLGREINRVASEMWDGYAWSFRYRNYRLITDIDYQTGTVTATNGSRTVTGSGTTFLSSHAGWHIYFPGDSILNWYKVRAFTSSTQIELDQPYQGTTGSGKTYILRHYDYTLPTEIWDLGTVAITADRRCAIIYDPTSIDLVGPAPMYNGSVEAIALYNSSSAVTSYSTGTLSGTINTTTLTGSGTSWLANVYPGDTMTIGSNVYTVYSVDSDTQITLYNQQVATSASSTSYTLTRQFQRVARILWPSNYNYAIDFRYLRKYAPLVNDNDTNELLYRYPDTLIRKASALEMSVKGDKRYAQFLQQAAGMVQIAKAEDASLTPVNSAAPIFSYRTGGKDFRRSIT